MEIENLLTDQLYGRRLGKPKNQPLLSTMNKTQNTKQRARFHPANSTKIQRTHTNLAQITGSLSLQPGSKHTIQLE